MASEEEERSDADRRSRFDRRIEQRRRRSEPVWLSTRVPRERRLSVHQADDRSGAGSAISLGIDQYA